MQVERLDLSGEWDAVPDDMGGLKVGDIYRVRLPNGSLVDQGTESEVHEVYAITTDFEQNRIVKSRPTFLGTPTQTIGGTMALDLDHIFMYHPPSPGQIPKYEALRDAAHDFAKAIVDLTPIGADQSAAIRHVREAVMTANAAIALGGRIHKEGR